MSTPSIETWPLSSSVSRKSVVSRVDLPEPLEMRGRKEGEWDYADGKRNGALRNNDSRASPIVCCIVPVLPTTPIRSPA